jgi:protocatechuate 3,4-dioxygenase alpha subunit
MADRTPSQTVGPFFHDALRWESGGRVAFAEPGKPIVLTGKLIDGAGQPVGDAMIETWQLSPLGRTAQSAAGASSPYGFGRVQTAKDGTYRFETSMPGGTVPCIDVAIFARGLLKPLRTRVYLAPEAQMRTDPALAPLASSPRLATLVAQPAGEAQYRWDVRLQGDGETVFFTA